MLLVAATASCLAAMVAVLAAEPPTAPAVSSAPADFKLVMTLYGVAKEPVKKVELIIKSGKARYAWVTLLPLTWVLAATLTAGWQKVFASDPRLGFLAHAATVVDQMAAGGMDSARGARLIFNDRLDAVVTLSFMTVTLLVVLASAREWVLILTRQKPAKAQESPFVETAYAG